VSWKTRGAWREWQKQPPGADERFGLLAAQGRHFRILGDGADHDGEGRDGEIGRRSRQAAVLVEGRGLVRSGRQSQFPILQTHFLRGAIPDDPDGLGRIHQGCGGGQRDIEDILGVQANHVAIDNLSVHRHEGQRAGRLQHVRPVGRSVAQLRGTDSHVARIRVAPALQEPLDAHVAVLTLQGLVDASWELMVADVVAPALQQAHGPSGIIHIYGLIGIAVVNENGDVEQPFGQGPGALLLV